MLERNVEERRAGLGEHLRLVAEVRVDVDPPAARPCDPGRQYELALDRDGLPVADEDARGHGREAIPGGEQPARFVERGADETPVDDARTGLVPLAERDRRVVALDTLFKREGKLDALGVVAASPAGGIVMRRNTRARVYLSPPRSKCAR
jgi:hypothetical protein